MRRYLGILIAVIVAANMTAASAFAAGPCTMPCCAPRMSEAVTESACEHCAPREAVSAPARPCCDMRGGGELSPATLNSSGAPVIDLSFAAGEAPASFTGISDRFPVKRILGEYESPPIFVLNATFIC